MNVKTAFVRINLSSLLYVEVIRHNLVYHTADDKITAYGTMKTLSEELEPHYFVMCNSCYLVNLAFVKKADNKDVYLKNGEVINIFPEGTRNHSYDEFLPFKGGAAALAIKTGAPIIPVVEIERIRFLHKVDVVYGDPIYLTRYYGKRLNSEELEEIDEWLRSVMMNMRTAFIERHNIKLKPLKPKEDKKKSR